MNFRARNIWLFSADKAINFSSYMDNNSRICNFTSHKVDRHMDFGENLVIASAERKAFSFLEEVALKTDTKEVFDTLFQYVERFGFNSFLAFTIPKPGESLADHTISNHWPDEWYDRYTTNSYFEKDAITRHLRSTSDPFYWSDVLIDSEDAISKNIAREARKFKLINGCCIPIFLVKEFPFVISLGTEKPNIDCKDFAAAYLMSTYAFNTMIKNNALPETVRKRHPSRLSARELECILWVSRGKTSWEIGEILNIAKSTVDEYVVSVCQKTDSVNRAQAVAECIRREEIVL